MNELPDGWRRAKLSEVCTIVSGGTPKTAVDNYWGGDIRWITPDDLSKNRAQVVNGGGRSLTRAGYASSSAKLMPAGSVIFSSRAPIGYVAIAGTDLCTNQGCKSAVPSGDIDSRYLYWQLVYMTPDIEARASGTTFREISGKRFGETMLALPPLVEQRTIVAVLEAYLSRIATQEETLRSILARISSMQEQIIPTWVAGVTSGGNTGLAPSDVDDGVLPDLLPGWRWKRLGDIADVVGGVTKDSKKQGDPSFVEVPYLRVANVQRGKLDLANVSMIRVPEQRARLLRLQPGDVLLNEGGDRDKLGRGWVWEGQIDNCIHQNHVFRARIHDRAVHPKILAWHANGFGKAWCERNGRQTTNLASISLRRIRQLPIPVPPSYADQREIVQEVEGRTEILRRTIAGIEKALSQAGLLRSRVLQFAFSGQLTLAGGDSD